MKLIIIRRPEVINPHLSGDLLLSRNGKVQLGRMIEICNRENVQAVAHSTLARATVGGRTLAAALSVPAISLNGLVERDFGSWNSSKENTWEWPRIAQKLATLSTEERYTFMPPGGESWQELENRLYTSLAHIASSGYDSAAVITHWAPIRVILPYLRNEPREAALHYDAGYGESFIEEYKVPYQQK